MSKSDKASTAIAAFTEIFYTDLVRVNGKIEPVELLSYGIAATAQLFMEHPEFMYEVCSNSYIAVDKTNNILNRYYKLLKDIMEGSEP